MRFKYNFHEGACVEYVGEPTDPPVRIQFINTDTDIVVYESVLTPNMWSRTNAQHFVKWRIVVTSLEGAILWEHNLDLLGKRVIIVYPYTTYGDFLYWMPIYERFRTKHGCHLIVQCSQQHYINSVCRSYPHIFFTTGRTTLINESIYAIYEPMLQTYDRIFWDGKYPRTSALQQAISTCLGLKHTPLSLLIDCDDERPNIEGKYVCVTEHGQSNPLKNWLYPEGYQIVANFLIEKGYKIVPISLEPTNLRGECIIDKTGLSLTEMTRYIKHAECLIGSSTGPIWVGVATKTPTICILTNTPMDTNFPVHYVYNHTEGTCFGCYIWRKQEDGPCDKKQKPEWAPNWIEVPECSLNITPDMVIEKVKEVLKIQ